MIAKKRWQEGADNIGTSLLKKETLEFFGMSNCFQVDGNRSLVY